MGSSKALLPWDGTTLVGYAIRELIAARATRIAVVVGADAEQVLAALPDSGAVAPVVNREYATGRSSSIRLGAAVIPPVCRALIVQSVDQPCPAWILRALYRAAEEDGVDVAVPVSGGWRGHPIGLSGRLLPELAAVREEEQGLRAVVRRHADSRREVPVESDVVHLNLNDRGAYERAYRANGAYEEPGGGSQQSGADRGAWRGQSTT
jgi:CTP:molybdopterin cytidylyltransferase MocA